jgi:hypothetical protein
MPVATEDGAFPVLVFDYSNPFPMSEDGRRVLLPWHRFDAWSSSSSPGVSVSAIHWALMWLDRRSSTESLAFIGELGPAWQESASQWLCGFVGGKTFDDAKPWLDHIGSPSVRSRVIDALVKHWMEADPRVVRQWAMESPADRLRSVLDRAEASVNADQSGGAAFLLLTLLPDNDLERFGGRGALLRTVLRSEGFLIHDYIQTHLSDEALRTICWSLAVDGERFQDADALRVLTVCEQTGDLDFKKRAQAELITAWLRWRNPATSGPYENGMMQLAGIPFFPWFMPAVPEL